MNPRSGAKPEPAPIMITGVDGAATTQAAGVMKSAKALTSRSDAQAGRRKLDSRVVQEMEDMMSPTGWLTK
jgi:hypothetical protein